MTVLEKFKSKTIDEIIDWFDEFASDNAPWWKWYDENYCNKCEPIKSERSNCLDYVPEFAYCELNGNCRFFKETDAIPNNKQIIMMWLESECE